MSSLIRERESINPKKEKVPMTEKQTKRKIRKMKVSEIRRELIDCLSTTDDENRICRAYEITFGKLVLGADRGEFNEKTGIVEVLG